MLSFSAGCVARLKGDTLALFIAGIAALNGVVAFVQEVVSGALHPFTGDYRFSGTLSPNTQGATLSMALIIALWHSWRSQGVSRRLSLLTALILLILVLMTGSRTSLIGDLAALVISILLLGFRSFKNALSRNAAILLFVLGLALVTTLTKIPGISPFDLGGATGVFATERDNGNISNLVGRNVIWEVCLRYAAARPLLGFGYGAFWTPNRIDAVADELGWAAFHGHSAYLDMWLQLGLPGVGLYILLLLTSIVTCCVLFVRSKDAYGTWAALLIFVAVNGATESTVTMISFPAFVLTIALVKLATKNDGQTS